MSLTAVRTANPMSNDVTDTPETAQRNRSERRLALCMKALESADSCVDRICGLLSSGDYFNAREEAVRLHIVLGGRLAVIKAYGQ